MSAQPKCVVCARYPDVVNAYFRECSHVDCPHRSIAWSDGTPTYVEHRRNVSKDPKPIDRDPDAPWAETI